MLFFRLFLLAVFPFLLPIHAAPPKPANLDDSVNWKALTGQSLFFLGVQHGFRLATEPGTRAGLGGPFWRGYYNSLSNLHGWADGDQFYVNYVGHPIQGAVSGFIWAQNDGKYRKVEFGNNPQYWKSRLRATAFSWVYSTQFEIGLLSEASIGKIQSRYPQQGFADHVATPLIGLSWQMAEDALDRFVIRRFEDRFENAFARMMVRSWLNPSRSFANLMRLKEPWHRDSRAGIWVHRKGMSPYRKPPAENLPDRNFAPFEFTTASQFSLSPGPRESLGCVGGMGTAQWNRSSRFGWVAEVGGCKMIDQRQNLSGDIMSYMVGPRWTDREGRWMPYVQILAGGKRVTIDEVFPEKKAELERQNPGKPLGYEFHPQWTKVNQANGFSVSVGGGVDYQISRAATWRLASVDLSYAWLPKPELASYPTTVRIAMGITLRVGNW
jgi:hypothetical protein